MALLRLLAAAESTALAAAAAAKAAAAHSAWPALALTQATAASEARS